MRKSKEEESEMTEEKQHDVEEPAGAVIVLIIEMLCNSSQRRGSNPFLRPLLQYGNPLAPHCIKILVIPLTGHNNSV